MSRFCLARVLSTIKLFNAVTRFSHCSWRKKDNIEFEWNKGQKRKEAERGEDFRTTVSHNKANVRPSLPASTVMSNLIQKARCCFRHKYNTQHTHTTHTTHTQHTQHTQHTTHTTHTTHNTRHATPHHLVPPFLSDKRVTALIVCNGIVPVLNETKNTVTNGGVLTLVFEVL
jgi:hypothetical protein